MRVALIHDWLLGQRGGEKVLSAIAQLFPKAELFTLLADRRTLTPELTALKLHTSWLQKLPGVRRYYRKLLPWMPGAVEGFDLSAFDLVISSSHCVAKGVRVPQGVPHLCYCHTPMRYAWHLQDLYVQRVPAMARGWVKSELMKLREWDRRTSERVTQFIANGKTVQRRIQEAYGRGSVVIHPPVDTGFYVPDSMVKREDYYLVVSALAPNKRIDLAINACQEMKRGLVIIGSGEEEGRLRRLARGETTMLGWCSNETIRHHLQRCRALLFPGEEDFGMVPIEAQACGAAVIAYGVGGATETVMPLGQGNPTGVWFMEPTVSSLIEAMKQFELESQSIQPTVCRANAEQFSSERFANSMRELVNRCLGTSGTHLQSNFLVITA